MSRLLLVGICGPCTEVLLIPEFRPPVTYYTSIANTLERPSRRFDAAMLKEVRRRLDSGQCSQEDIDELTVDMTDEAAEVRDSSI